MLSNVISVVVFYILNGNISLFVVIMVDIVYVGCSYINIV